MNEISALLNFGGYTALLLWGIHMLQSGVQRAFGARLGLVMSRALGTRARAFFTGLGITAAIQSSTAAGLMITSFAAGGMVALTPGLAAMLGANVGTTVIVQLLSFNLTALAPAAILIGVWLFRRHQPSRRRDLGRVFIGFGLLLLALHELVRLLTPLQNSPLLDVMLDVLADQPLIALLLAAALTWLAHSSVAVVVLIMSLASHELMASGLIYALVLGANLGTAINPVLEGSTSKDPASRRLPIGNLGTRVAGCILALVLLPWIPQMMSWVTADSARAVANFHTLFNVAVALIFLPVLRQYAKLITRLLPKRSDPDDPSRPLYLDESAHEVPAIALGNASREALRTADMLQLLLDMTRASLLSDNRHRIRHAHYLCNAISRLDVLITTYLATLDQESMNKDDHRRLGKTLTFTKNITRAANAVTNGLLEHTATLTKKGWSLSTAQRDTLVTALDRLIRNQRRMAALFVAEDVRSARYLAYEKDHFRKLEADATEQHLAEIKSGTLTDAELGSVFLNIIRDTKTVNSYLVEAAAYPILERHNELLPSRLREVDE